MARPRRLLAAVLAAAALWSAELAAAEDDAGMEDHQEFGGELEEPESGAEDMDEEAVENLEPLTPAQLTTLHGLMDLNKDGKVSLEESLAFARDMGKTRAMKESHEMLSTLDTSADGRLQLEEHLGDLVQAAGRAEGEDKSRLEKHQEWETKRFHAADVNGDGVLDKAEVVALFFPEHSKESQAVLRVALAQAMHERDRNGDGTLNAHEFWADDSEDRETEERQDEDFRKLDKNGDGQIDLAELEHWETGRFHTEKALDQLFELADHNKDGGITAKELSDSGDGIANSDLHYHVQEWVDTNEL